MCKMGSQVQSGTTGSISLPRGISDNGSLAGCSRPLRRFLALTFLALQGLFSCLTPFILPFRLLFCKFLCDSITAMDVTLDMQKETSMAASSHCSPRGCFCVGSLWFDRWLTHSFLSHNAPATHAFTLSGERSSVWAWVLYLLAMLSTL